MKKYTYTILGFALIAFLLAFGISRASASQTLEDTKTTSTNIGGGSSDADQQSNSGNIIQANIAMSGTISIVNYPPLGTMVLTTTQVLSGNFPPNPYFYPCEDATDLVFSSTGGTCTLNPNTQLITCPTGITSFKYSYACTSIPVVTATNLSISLTSNWTGGSIDRTWDFGYTPLIYQAASLPPDLDTGQMLRWTQIDEANLTLDIFFSDPRINLLFLPAIRK